MFSGIKLSCCVYDERKFEVSLRHPQRNAQTIPSDIACPFVLQIGNASTL
jgi:hypothetical protein